jgi:D-alanyl-D-alanine carboxypeptidase (penicillin-binding protein 5/6)
MRFSDLSEAGSWLSSLVSYAFVPVEYYRNTFTTPMPLKVAAAAVTVAVLVSLGIYVVRPAWRGSIGSVLLDRPDRVLLVGSVLMAIAFYLAYSVLIWWIAARLAFLTAPAAAVLFGVATRDRWGTGVRIGVLGLYLVASVWLVAGASNVRPQPYWIVLG